MFDLLGYKLVNSFDIDLRSLWFYVCCTHWGHSENQQLKRNLRLKKVKLKWKSVNNKKKMSHHRPQCAKWFSRYSISKSGIWARWTSPFCTFSASFSLKYDVTDAILQDNEKMKVWWVFCLICLKLHRLSEPGKGISLHLKFCGYGDQNQNYFLLLKKQKVYCLSKSDVQKVI